MKSCAVAAAADGRSVYYCGNCSHLVALLTLLFPLRSSSVCCVMGIAWKSHFIVHLNCKFITRSLLYVALCLLTALHVLHTAREILICILFLLLTHVKCFLSRVSTAMLTRDIDIGILSIRHVPVLYQNGLKYRHYFFTAR